MTLSRPFSRPFSGPFYLALGLTLLFVIWSLSVGEATLSFWQVLFGEASHVDHHIFYQLRLPRVLHGWLNGCVLGLAGVALQALFRNPLADPGVIGVSAGATLGAVLAIMLGVTTWYLLPLQAFAGGLLLLLILLRLSSLAGELDSQHILLIGIAVNALVFAAVGMAAAYADANQLRSVWEWNLGGLRNVQWSAILLMFIMACLGSAVLFRQRHALDTLLLGEQAAFFAGVAVSKVKFSVILASALLISASVAFTGMIGFIGLVAPHIARRLVGASHVVLLPMSALVGGILMVVADMGARLIFAPTELPVGIVTALIGAPFFLFLLVVKKGRYA